MLGNGLIGLIVIMFINIWLLKRIFGKLLKVIGSVPSSIMRWIGGGFDPFHDNSAEAGKGFAQQVMGRGESALQAGAGANKNRAKDKKAQDNHDQSLAAQKDHTAAVKENTAKMDQVIGGASNGGKGGSPGGSNKAGEG